ncbi:MAG: cyanophycinase [Bacteroidetes bacterium]|nr:cyanophycinase [Bacteroidota bacterium]
MKKMSKSLSILLLIAAQILAGSENSKGHLFIIGGGDRSPELMNKYFELVGDYDSKIVIIPMASSVPLEVAQEQKEEFIKLGCKNVDFIYCDNITADVDSNLLKMENVKAVFFSGGDQARLTAALLGTKLLEKIKKVYNEGGVVGGTSAGAAIMSEVMITGDELINKDKEDFFIAIQKGNIKTTEGFGFVKTGIIDQHFVLRKRLNRLISVVLEHPNLLGIGIDESTAIIVNPDSTFEVAGERTVLIFNATDAKDIRTNKEGLLSASGIKLDILQSGEKYNLKQKCVIK